MLLVLTGLALPAAAQAAPNITLGVDAQTQVLYGESSTVSLTAQNPAGEPYGYNLSYSVELPPGISYVGGSAGAIPGDPQVIVHTIPGPQFGTTTLIWKNVSDLSPSSTNALTFEVKHSSVALAVSDTFTIVGNAYVNSNPRFVPKFDSVTGAAIPGATSYTGSASGTDATEITAIQITKDSTNAPEGELLRGVHDHQSIYTLTIQNNNIAPTGTLNVDDYLPANLEFLGCGGAGADNTTDAPTNPGSAQEYPGSGAITVSAVPGCIQPTTVEFGTFDPPGPAPSGLYTHVRWAAVGPDANNGLAAGPNADTAPPPFKISYKAAIPIRANTNTWTTSGGAPTPASLDQTANLDNNSGPESADEDLVKNYAATDGLLNNDPLIPVSDDTSLTRTAEDLDVQKSGSTGVLVQGGLVQWTLHIRTSEYRSASDVQVGDLVPSGLCPVQASGSLETPPSSTTPNPACAAGPNPSAPYTSTAENITAPNNGAWQVHWDSSTDPALASMDPSTTHDILFTTRTGTDYQANGGPTTPILTNDTVSNHVDIDGDSNVACAPGAITCAVGDTNYIAHDGPVTDHVIDESDASIASSSITIDKKVADSPPSGASCATSTYVDAEPSSLPATLPAYHPGDQICWLLNVTYPSNLDTNNGALQDFLPSSVTLDTAFGTGGDAPTANDTSAAIFNNTNALPGPGGDVNWTIPVTYIPGNKVFERYLATTAELPTGASDGDIDGNLLRVSSINTDGESFPLRDQSNFTLSLPDMSLDKTIVSGGNNAVPTSNQTVNGGDVIGFRIRLTNSGTVDSTTNEVWDSLPAGVTCADVSLINLGGICGGDNIIRWGGAVSIGPDVTAGGGTADLTYSVTVPTSIQGTQVLTNTAGIREFHSDTNRGGSFTYVPANNIDPTVTTTNVPRADDTATITGATPTIVKARTTLTTETGNTAAQATIGETVRYTLTTTIPAGVTVKNFTVRDPVNTTLQAFTAGSLTQLSGPAVSNLTFDGTNVGFDLGATYTAPAVPDPGDVIVIQFDMTVRDVTGNRRNPQTTITNRGNLNFTRPPGQPAGTTTINSNTVSTDVVEPVIGVVKSVDVGSSPVAGGQTVQYTVVMSNGNAVRTSPAHDSFFVDTVPADITPLNSVGALISDGESTTDGGVWNLAARTLTFPAVATLNPAASQSFSYQARVAPAPAGGSALTNSVLAKTTSMPGTVTGERTAASGPPTPPAGYQASSSVTLTVQTASVTKGANVTDVTPGNRVQYNVDVKIPANTVLYDATVKDVLPPSVAFDGYVSAVCTVGCAPGPTTPTINTYTPAAGAGGTLVLAWDLGDLTTAAPTDRTIHLVYDAHLLATDRNGLTVSQPLTPTNSVTVSSNRTDVLVPWTPTTPIPSGFDDTSTPATKALNVVEPAVSIDKQISVNGAPFVNGPVTVKDGDTLAYQLVVTNTGSSDLYDATVQDIPDTELRNVVLAPGVSTTSNTKLWSAGSLANRTMTWQLAGPIAAASSVTLTYSADLIAVANLTDGQVITNTATVPASWGVPLATRTTDGFQYKQYAATPDSTTAVFESLTLSIAKTTGSGTGPVYPESAQAEVGQSFPWRVVVTNTSTAETATNVHISDVLPKNWAYVPGTATFSPGGALEPTTITPPAAAGPQLEWASTFSIAPGASIVLTYSAKPLLAAATDPGTGPANPHVNTAQVDSLNGAGHAGDASGPFAAGPDSAQAVLAVPTLTVDKTPDAGSQAAGTTINFHVVVKNVGLVNATNVVVTDTLPTAAGTSYVPGSATAVGIPAVPAPVFSETGASATTVTWTIGTILPGNSVDITVPIKTDPASVAGLDVSNNVGAVSDQTATPITDVGNVVLTNAADLAASKSFVATPSPAVAGGDLAYTIGATNNGPSVAEDVVLTDVLPTTVTYVSASPECVYTSATRTVVCTFPGTTAVGGTVSATINTKLNADATTNANNSVTVSSATPDPNPLNDTASVVVPLTTATDMSIVKTTASPTVLRDQQTSYTLAITNSGPSDAQGVVISDPLPAGTTFVSADAPCANAANTVTCNVGTVVAGATLSYDVIVTADTLGSQVNTATVSSTTTETDPTNNSSSATFNVLPATDLGITKTAPATVAAGGNLTYTLDVINNGPDAATGVTVSDPLPVGTTFVSGDPGCTAAAGVVTCVIGPLASGASTTVHFTVKVAVAAGTTVITNNATVHGNEGDPVPANDTDSASTQVGPTADLFIQKTGPATISMGGSITWTLLVRNFGPSDATGVTVADTLPAGTTFASVTPSQGTCANAAGLVTCDLGTIPVGASSLITLSATTADSLAGTSVTNFVSVTGTEPDPDAGNNVSASSTTINKQVAETAQLQITKTADSVGRVGQPLTYTINSFNKGPAPATDVVVTDALSPNVTFNKVSTNHGTCAYADVTRTVTCQLGTLAMNGDATITLWVTPIAPGVLRNSAVISGSNAAPADAGGVAGVETQVDGPLTSLSIKKSVSKKKARPGDRLTYTVTIRNTGKATATGVQTCDNLPKYTSFTSTKGGSLKRGQLCFALKSLAAGKSKTYKVHVRVSARAPKSLLINRATTDADNAAKKNASAGTRIVSDGAVNAENLNGLTG